MPFRALQLTPQILKNIQEAGYTEPTPIQLAAIPEILSGHNQPVTTISFSHNGKFLATGSWDNTAIVWDLRTRHFKRLNEHRKPVRAIAFSWDDKRIVTGSEDASMKIWDVETGRETLTLKDSNLDVRACAFSRDNTLLEAATREGIIQRWKATRL